MQRWKTLLQLQKQHSSIRKKKNLFHWNHSKVKNQLKRKNQREGFKKMLAQEEAIFQEDRNKEWQ